MEYASNTTNGNHIIETDHRSSLRIVADVLRAAMYENTKSCLFRQANLNHVRGERYLDFCVERRLIRPHADGYEVTEKGRAYLNDWAHLEQYLVAVEEGLDYR